MACDAAAMSDVAAVRDTPAATTACFTSAPALLQYICLPVCRAGARKELNCIAEGRLGLYLPPSSAAARIFNGPRMIEALREVRQQRYTVL